MTIGQNIRALREKTGLYQSELAERVDVGQQYISRIENDKKLPSTKTLIKIARALKCTLDDLTRDEINRKAG